MNYSRACFVIMPYGKRTIAVGEDGTPTREVDFDAVYTSIFERAISGVQLPEGGTLEPRRCDKDRFAGVITQDMFDYLEYSRLAIADITGLNANAMYELGVRHRARPSGTVIVRQTNAPIPFDIKSVRAFAYDSDTDEQADLARRTLQDIVAQTLTETRLDSPVQQALRAQQGHAAFDALLRQAEEEIRAQQWAKARATYLRALELQPTNPLIRIRLGVLLKDQGAWNEALDQLEQALALSPDSAVAWREKGIVQHKRDGTHDPQAGVDALGRAIALDPVDYDALASLGGIRKRQRNLDAARDLYRRASEISRGNSYPLLNYLIVDAHLRGVLALDETQLFQLRRTERALVSNVAQHPPLDPPWSFFALAVCRLFDRDRNGFIERVEEGLEVATNSAQAHTFRGTLQLLVEGGVDLPGLVDGLALTERREALLS